MTVSPSEWVTRSTGAQRSLLIVEDDGPLATMLRRSFQQRAYNVLSASSLDEAECMLATYAPELAVVDLNLPGRSGLECVKFLHHRDPAMKIVVLTGFAGGALAMEAIKLGARHYIFQPTDADEIEAAFVCRESYCATAVSGAPKTVKMLEWEYVHEMLFATQINLSETMRRLNMYRRTLARKFERRRAK